MSEEAERRAYLEQAKRDALAPWDGKRGVGCIDRNGRAVHVRASVEETAGVLARGAVRWERDVLDQPVTPGDQNLLVFRLRGHSWSVVVDEGADAAELSRELQTEVIDYWVSDTFGATGYTLYEKGARTESFHASEGEDANEFESTTRTVRLQDRENIWDWVDQFFRSRDAFEPGLAYEYFFRDDGKRPTAVRLILRDAPGLDDRPRVRNPGWRIGIDGEEVVSKPELEQIDLVVLRDRPGRVGRILLG